MRIRKACDSDDPAIWRLLEPAIRGGEVFALPRDLDRSAAVSWWRAPATDVFVLEADQAVAGSYYLRANQRGPGAHVANAGYVTAEWAGTCGIGRALCEHSLDEARRRGFHAMQFNFVVSTNERAVRLWMRCGFEVVGRLPGAFAHPTLGMVDALVMHRWLGTPATP